MSVYALETSMCPGSRLGPSLVLIPELFSSVFLLLRHPTRRLARYLDPAQAGKSSMSARHRFLTVKNLNWQWFNILTFGLGDNSGGGSAHTRLVSAITKLKRMKQAAHQFTTATEAWSPVDNVGLFFHVYGWNSVNALHLHIVDGAATGPTYDTCQHKNLPLSAALEVFLAELKVLRRNIASGKGKGKGNEKKVGGDAAEDERLAQVLAVLDDNGTGTPSSLSATPTSASGSRSASTSTPKPTSTPPVPLPLPPPNPTSTSSMLGTPAVALAIVVALVAGGVVLFGRK